MDNKHTTEDSSEEILNNSTESNVSHATMNSEFGEIAFNDIMNNIKVETYSLFHKESRNLEDSASIANKSIDNKNKNQQQGEMCKLASTSYEKDVNVSESNSLELTDTKLVDSKTVSIYTSSPSAALPTMKISPISESDTCFVRCSKCNNALRLLDSHLHVCVQNIDKQNEFVKSTKRQRLDEKYSYYDNTTKSYGNKNNSIEKNYRLNPSPRQLKHTLRTNPYFRNKKKSWKKHKKNVMLDEDTSDSDNLSIILLDSGSLSDSEIKVCDTNISLDSEMFSESSSEEILSDCEIKERDFIIVDSDDLSLDSEYELVNSKLVTKLNSEIGMDCTFVSDREKSLDSKIILNGENKLVNYSTLLDSVKNCEIGPDAKTESDNDQQSHINIPDTKEQLNSKNLSTFKVVSNVQKGSEREILLDGNKVFETVSWSEKGPIKYKIIYDDEIKPSANKGSTCVIISENNEEFNNKEFITYNINVKKGSDSKILLDGEKVEIVSESENSKAKYTIFEYELSANKNPICIILFDNEKEFFNKKLTTLKILSNVTKVSDDKMLLDGEKVYDIENGMIKYVIVSKDKIESSGNKGYTIISNDEEKLNNKKSTFKVLVKNVQKGSNSLLLGYKKSHGKISNTINRKPLEIKYRLSFPCLELAYNEDYEQEYFKDYFSAIRQYFETTESPSLKALYSRIGNPRDMLLYLMENLRMFYNKELVVSETADEFSKDYLKSQETTLYNCFGDPRDGTNASKPFIHPSGHLHQISKGLLSSNYQPMIIKDITTTSSTKNNSIAPLKKKFCRKKQSKK